MEGPGRPGEDHGDPREIGMVQVDLVLHVATATLEAGYQDGREVHRAVERPVLQQGPRGFALDFQQTLHHEWVGRVHGRQQGQQAGQPRRSDHVFALLGTLGKER
jgi:hypothetical protein